MRPGNRHLGIVGTGLIGGSLGLALVGTGFTRVGWDRDDRALCRAVARGAVDRGASSLDELARSCDVIVLALPPRHVVATARALLDCGASPKALFNAASVQERAFVSLAPLFDGRYAGFHPMAGKERGGIDEAEGGLFQGALCAVVADGATNPSVVDEALSLAELIGARSTVMKPEEHDAAAGCVSHLPLLVATALAVAAGGEIEKHPAYAALIGGGFRDTTRVASGPSWLAADVWAENRSLRELVASLIAVLEGMADGGGDEMERLASLGAARREAALSRRGG
ncbi:MAG: prephenate dehydrogenase/arogenate dehydrogenase family protein [Synergistaceae bacterium]|jgi:prephenate dehydrogenase|nr:prephenate dehydrogenase/arogenate dehydrogenase family protein [Synergistaceae bacterium]